MEYSCANTKYYMDVGIFVYTIGYIEYFPLKWEVYFMSIVYICSFNFASMGTISTYSKEHVSFEKNKLYISLNDKKKINKCIYASIVCWIIAIVAILGKHYLFNKIWIINWNEFTPL